MKTRRTADWFTLAWLSTAAAVVAVVFGFTVFSVFTGPRLRTGPSAPVAGLEYVPTAAPRIASAPSPPPPQKVRPTAAAPTSAELHRGWAPFVDVRQKTPTSPPTQLASSVVQTPKRPARKPAPGVDLGFEQFTVLRHTEVTEAASPDTAHVMFNARSCAECHRQGGIGGAGPNENNVRLFNKLVVDLSHALANHFGPGPGSAVVHRQSLSTDYAAWRIKLIEELAPHDSEITELVRRGVRGLPNPFGPSGAAFEQRNTPPLFGLGLIESIPQSEIDAVAAGQPKAIGGRSPRLQGGGFGRFGWKSSTATLAAFNENACAVELGLSTPKFKPAYFHPAHFKPTSGSGPEPFHYGPPIDPAIGVAAAAQRRLDMTSEDLSALTGYVSKLPAPRQVVAWHKREQIAAGAKFFQEVGCAECHKPDLGGVSGLYSDLLLHSIGTSGGGFYYSEPSSTPTDREPDFDIVRADEFRTPPLWGLADSGPYLHDGSAATIEQAIARHTIQAEQSATKYRNLLTNEERVSLIVFLESLRAPAR
jgi:CxxC motif-containing protein (DUF1111 family)